MENALPNLRNIKPRDYQIDAYNSCAESIRNYNGPFFVEASVGAGKTIAMAMLAARARDTNMPVLILARRGELVEQNSETLWDCGVKNSIFSASVGARSTHYPIIIGSEGTVARALHAELKDFSPMLLIIDENHEVDFTSEESQYMKIINTLQKRNPKMRVIGMTGSPYRGTKDILGDLWRKCVYKITTQQLVDRGFLVPTFFGYESQQTEGYDLKEFHVPDDDTHSDFTQKEMLAMQIKITSDSTATQKIMTEVIALTENRNGVMITGAGKKHLEQIAACLPDGSYAIITESTGSKERAKLLKQVRDGSKKYVLQIGCLTTGFDAPIIDTSVIMRKIGSLTLLVQLLGRGMRLLKQKHIDDGIIKKDHLVLDYSDTMEEMADKYYNPILEQAQIDKSKKERDLITCPVCSTLNSSHARRCINRPDDLERVVKADVNGRKNYAIDGRCEWFWQSRECPHCNTPNDTTARECRQCKKELIDPNANLKGKHYTDDDFREVVKMTMRLTKSADGVLVDYLIRDQPGDNDKTVMHNNEQLIKATEILFPQRRERWARGPWFEFLKKHLHKSWHNKIIGKSAPVIVKQAAIFDVPTMITYRLKPDGKSIIHRKRFSSGREV